VIEEKIVDRPEVLRPDKHRLQLVEFFFVTAHGDLQGTGARNWGAAGNIGDSSLKAGADATHTDALRRIAAM
jgi:hypothetical protein